MTPERAIASEWFMDAYGATISSMFYTYVLQSLLDGKQYIGFSRNLRERFKAHQEGNVESTKHRRPLKIIFYEAFVSEEDALRREAYFKTTKGKIALKAIVRASSQL